MTALPILHFAPGTCARVPLIALEEIGEPFETRLVAFMAGGHRRPDFLAKNPAGKVPVLEFDDAVLTQNSAILQFLARKFPEAKLLPLTGDPLGDASVQAQLAWFSADLHPLVTRIRMPRFLCDLEGGPARVRELAGEAMAFQLRCLEDDLGKQPWVLGEAWSLLDAYLFWVWFRITGAGFPEDQFPNIAAHHERMRERPSVRRTLAREAAALSELEVAGLAVPLD
ncbi:MAG TPA: glutathione S-transferase family protein [Sphingomonadaceae bacterium]|nr:glutathione S-transferase family protein [Sphingomonadaceae bacterium]